MTLYDTRQRCPMCRNHGLPCNDAVHGRQTALHPVMGLVEARRDPAAARVRRAQTITTVALIVIMLAAGIVAIGAYAWAFHPFGETCEAPPCAPVQLVSTPVSPPPWQ